MRFENIFVQLIIVLSGVSQILTSAPPTSSRPISSLTKDDVRCPCMPPMLCNRPHYGSSSLDVLLHGQVFPCTVHGHVRCCREPRPSRFRQRVQRPGLHRKLPPPFYKNQHLQSSAEETTKTKIFRHLTSSPDSHNTPPQEIRLVFAQGSVTELLSLPENAVTESTLDFVTSNVEQTSDTKELSAIEHSEKQAIDSFSNQQGFSYTDEEFPSNTVFISAENLNDEIASDEIVLASTDDRKDFQRQNITIKEKLDDAEQVENHKLDQHEEEYADEHQTTLNTPRDDLISAERGGTSNENVIKFAPENETNRVREGLNEVDLLEDGQIDSIEEMIGNGADKESSGEIQQTSVMLSDGKLKKGGVLNGDLVQEVNFTTVPLRTAALFREISTDDNERDEREEVNTHSTLSSKPTPLAINASDLKVERGSENSLDENSLGNENRKSNEEMDFSLDSSSEKTNMTVFSSSSNVDLFAKKSQPDSGENSEVSVQKAPESSVEKFPIDLQASASEKRSVEIRNPPTAILLDLDENQSASSLLEEHTETNKSDRNTNCKYSKCFGNEDHQVRKSSNIFDIESLLLKIAETNSNGAEYLNYQAPQPDETHGEQTNSDSNPPALVEAHIQQENIDLAAQNLPVSIVYNSDYSPFLSHCVEFTKCRRWYGSRPSDSEVFGHLKECPTNHVRCLDGLTFDIPLLQQQQSVAQNENGESPYQDYRERPVGQGPFGVKQNTHPGTQNTQIISLSNVENPYHNSEQNFRQEKPTFFVNKPFHATKQINDHPLSSGASTYNDKHRFVDHSQKDVIYSRPDNSHPPPPRPSAPYHGPVAHPYPGHNKLVDHPRPAHYSRPAGYVHSFRTSLHVPHSIHPFNVLKHSGPHEKVPVGYNMHVPLHPHQPPAHLSPLLPHPSPNYQHSAHQPHVSPDYHRLAGHNRHASRPPTHRRPQHIPPVRSEHAPAQHSDDTLSEYGTPKPESVLHTAGSASSSKNLQPTSSAEHGSLPYRHNHQTTRGRIYPVQEYQHRLPSANPHLFGDSSFLFGGFFR